MHELSIVASLIELCEENAKKQKANKINEIYTKMGVLSGIEKEQFILCFESFKQGTICQEARLFIEDEPLCASCECGFNGELKENSFFCPQCKGGSLKITAGEDFYLLRLIMQ